MSTDESGTGGVDRLDATRAEGLWAVRSESRTVYYVDLDRGRMMRERGTGSGAFLFDNEWVRLVEVASRSEVPGPVHAGEIRVGERARYLLDPWGGVRDYEWRLQRIVTAIERITGEEAETLRDRWANRAGSPDGGAMPLGDVGPVPRASADPHE